MAFKLIAQDVETLRQAYQQRKREYDILRKMGEWPGVVLQAGILVELALKIATCKHLDVTRLPKVFQVHDLEFLLYCSGSNNLVKRNPNLYDNFRFIVTNWTMELRYEGKVITEQEANDVHQALFDPSDGVLTFLLKLL